MKYKEPEPKSLEQQAKEMTKYRNKFLKDLDKFEKWSRKSKIMVGEKL